MKPAPWIASYFRNNHTIFQVSHKNNKRTRAAENRVASDGIPTELESLWSDVLVKTSPFVFTSWSSRELSVCFIACLQPKTSLSMILSWENYYRCCSFHLTMWAYIYIYQDSAAYKLYSDTSWSMQSSVRTVYSQLSCWKSLWFNLTFPLHSHNLWLTFYLLFTFPELLLACHLCSQSLWLACDLSVVFQSF